MKTERLDRGDLETPCPSGAGSRRGGSSRSVLLARVKWLLQRGARSARAEQGRACLAAAPSRPGGCPRKKLLLALGVATALLLMGLLLLWHYKCIVLDQVCEGNREVLPPLFRSLLREGAGN